VTRVHEAILSGGLDAEHGEAGGDLEKTLVGGVGLDVIAEEGADLPGPFLQVEPQDLGLLRVGDLGPEEGLGAAADLQPGLGVDAQGAEQLSLRAIARELGMVSSALYRYFPSRDELLTALIIDAYDAVGAAAEEASASGPVRNHRARWLSVCRAIRQWAIDHPHEYALIYGSPVAGYKAPQATTGPAARVPLVLLGLVRQAYEGGTLEPSYGGVPLGATLRKQLLAVAEDAVPGLPPDVLSRVVIAWTQLFGMISFELFGHLVGSVDPSKPFFDHATEQLAHFVGLRRP
jgi:AcrR family transcriptional regulator